MKALTIHHDFNLGLKLYTIPKIFLELIYEKFPNVTLRIILEANIMLKYILEIE